MKSGSPSVKIFGFILMFLMLFFSYKPLTIEIDVLANNETTTNAVVQFLDSWFGLFWASLIVFILALLLYVILKEV